MGSIRFRGLAAALTVLVSACAVETEHAAQAIVGGEVSPEGFAPAVGAIVTDVGLAGRMFARRR